MNHTNESVDIFGAGGYASDWVQSLIKAESVNLEKTLPLGYVSESGWPPSIQGPSINEIKNGMLFVGASGFGVRKSLITMALSCMYRNLPVTFIAANRSYQILQDTIPESELFNTAFVDLSSPNSLSVTDAVQLDKHQVFRASDNSDEADADAEADVDNNESPILSLLGTMAEEQSESYRDERVVIISGVSEIVQNESDWLAIRSAVSDSDLGIILWTQRPTQLHKNARDAVTTCNSFSVFNPGSSAGAEWIEEWFNFSGNTSEFLSLETGECFSVFTHGFAGRLQTFPLLPPRERAIMLD